MSRPLACPTLPLSAQVHWVKPKLPTALDHLEFLPLPKRDLLFTAVNGTCLLAGSLDIPRLKDALSLTLRDFPHLAGRLFYSEKDHSWKIRLKNEPVSIKVSKNDDIDPPEELMQIFASHPDVYDKLPSGPVINAPPESPDECPLVRFRVTEWKNGETTIGTSLCHILADGVGMIHMLNTFSAHYTKKLPLPAAPTFEKFFDVPPECPRTALPSILPLMMDYGVMYERKELQAMYAEAMAADSELMRLRFSKKQLIKIKTLARRHAGSDVSTTDALAGYAATLLNRIYDDPVQVIYHGLGYRGAPSASKGSFSPPPITSQGNAFMWANTKTFAAKKNTSLGTYALLLYSSRKECMQPQTLTNLISFEEEVHARGAKTQRFKYFGVQPGSMRWNSICGVPTHNMDFGFEGRVRIYIGYCHERSFYAHAANPIKHVDANGNISWESGAGAIEVLIGVPKGMRGVVKAVVERDLGLACKL